MKPQTEILESIREAFAGETGPARCRNPRHCEECEEADRMLLDLDPRDLALEDLDSEARNWIFSFASDESLRWLTPGMVRVALGENPPQPHLFFDRIRQRASDVFSDEQWITKLELADFCCEHGWIPRGELGFIGPGAARDGDLPGNS